MNRLKKPLFLIEAATGGEGEAGAEAGAGGSGQGDGKTADKSFTQADVDRIVQERVQRAEAKYADYDALKSKAEGAKTLEDRIAEMETRATNAEVAALRSKYAVDVPEKLRPLLTGTTDEELKAQAELLAEGESERKKKNNVSPREGTNPQSGSDPMREFTRGLFARANSD